MIRAMVILGAALASSPAFAHTGATSGASFLSGFAHPLGGLDHLLAMVTVGLWAALAGGRALWLWPTAFVGAMLVGGGLGMVGVPLPLVEPGILASIVVLGALVAFAVKAPTALGAGLIALFGLAHGHAHGAEMPSLSGPVAYAMGFALATAILHALGLALGWGALQARAPMAVRGAGGLAALAGLTLAFG